MHMPDSPQLVLAAFPTWPYDPEESQEPPCCLHAGRGLGNLIPQLSNNYSPGLPPAEVMEKKKKGSELHQTVHFLLLQRSLEMP